MESVHGVDVSWMTHSSHNSQRSDPSSRKHHAPAAPTEKAALSVQNGNVQQPKDAAPTSPKPIPHRPGFTRGPSIDKTAALSVSTKTPPPGTSRRNSWLSSISSKFSSSPGPHAPATPPGGSPTIPATLPTQEPPVPTGPSTPKNAVLPHALKPTGDVPYTPAPPKSTQPSFLQSALRRLSSSGGQLASGPKHMQNGLCERRVLNVDQHRERCLILELDASKLRRVAFCVDVEIASGPRYTDDTGEDEEKEKKQRNKLSEKGEGAALKHPEAVKYEKAEDGVIKASGEEVPKERKTAVFESTTEVTDDTTTGEKEHTKKREKKKRSEEERKARKEKKRRIAEANGTLPVELVRGELNGSQSSFGGSTPPGSGTPKTQASPTTDPVRIYRRCCQLRETPVLKKITEQLGAAIPIIGPPGIVGKLDLTGYWLQLPDLITLGDYLAVVPVKELIMENCGLTDEGVRVILAGLLAAKSPDHSARKRKAGKVLQGGVIERLVFKNNTKIGRDGWRYISLFINMCRSLKSLDLSKVPLPQAPALSASHANNSPTRLSRTTSASSTIGEVSCLLSRAIGERLAGNEFELLNLAECGITTEQLSDLVDGINKSGLRRLGIARNNITSEGMKHVVRFIKGGHCEGLDLGGNNLRDQLGVIADALDDDSDLFALSLADCNLNPESLWTIFPALVKLKNIRFLDLSQNHELFEASPSALSLLRRYLPKMPILKRIHLTDVSMTPEQAIALAEILPDTPSLAHVNILENPKLAALANAHGEADQEEACALYASLMAAVRVSKTIICIDIEVPSNDSSEIVKALAKQVVAYCLWNMERGPVAEISEAAAATSESPGIEKEVAVPDVLLHLVGHVEGFHENHDDDEPAPDDDYVIGGTGVVKALGICLLNRGNDSRRPSADRTQSDMSEAPSGSVTPKTPVSGGKAKQMSKNLLGSARKIRARLQPALVKEARSGDQNNYQRLLFLDRTLEGMIKRFEDEFPETRLAFTVPSPAIPDPVQLSPVSSIDLSNGADEPAFPEAPISDDEEGLPPVLSRHNSDVSLASRALSQEEGRMHRFGQKFRRDILKHETEDHLHGSIGQEEDPNHMKLLRAMVEGLGGEEIRARLERDGEDAVLEELNNDASLLKRELIAQDPEGWKKFEESMEVARRNTQVGSGQGVGPEGGRQGSAIE